MKSLYTWLASLALTLLLFALVACSGSRPEPQGPNNDYTLTCVQDTVRYLETVATPEAVAELKSLAGEIQAFLDGERTLEQGSKALKAFSGLLERTLNQLRNAGIEIPAHVQRAANAIVALARTLP